MRIFLLATLLSLTLFGGSVRVAVAANMSYAIDALIKAYKQHYPKSTITVTIASSGKLASQILHYAPYDIFLSANTAYPQKLYEANRSSKPIVYAQGSLILLSKKKRDFSDIPTLLTSKNIKKIAVANPRTAPYGKATHEYMTHTKMIDKLRQKLVYAESIAQTLTYTLTATDIGIVSKSAVFMPHMQHYTKGQNWTELSSRYYTPIRQSMVLINQTNQEAQQFFTFLQSDEAHTILQKFGYHMP